MFEIAVLDRNEILLDLLDRELAHEEGYSVSEYENSDYFLESTETAPDLIITDLILDDVSGFEFIQEIKNDSKYSEIPIIVMTEKLNESTISRLEKLDVKDIIEKPMKMGELLFRIEKIRTG